MRALDRGISRAPWSQEEVESLTLRQKEIRLHPYTCGNDSRHTLLVPTNLGWMCTDCDYTQDWAHKADTERWFDALSTSIIAQH